MAQLILPISLTGKKELIKVQREFELLSEQLIESKVAAREVGQKRQVTAISDVANELMVLNKITLSQQTLPALNKELQKIRDTAPLLRVSFAVEPDRESISKIVSWFRKEVNPNLLLQVGIQPSIAGGCIVQTPGNRYDFSLRRHILESTDKFKAVLARDVFNKQPEPIQTPAGAEA